MSRAWTRVGATHELWDGRDRYLVAASRSRDITEHLCVRVIPVDAAPPATMWADRIGLTGRLRRQCGAPARSQLGREHWRQGVAPPACRGPPQVAECQGAGVLPGRWLARHRSDGDWTFRNGAHAARSFRLGTCRELSTSSIRTASQHHPGAAGSSYAGSWGGSIPTLMGGSRD